MPEPKSHTAPGMGTAIPAVDVATGYASKQNAFGQPVAAFQRGEFSTIFKR